MDGNWTSLERMPGLHAKLADRLHPARRRTQNAAAFSPAGIPRIVADGYENLRCFADDFRRLDSIVHLPKARPGRGCESARAVIECPYKMPHHSLVGALRNVTICQRCASGK